jgi:hypothetical protein
VAGNPLKPHQTRNRKKSPSNLQVPLSKGGLPGKNSKDALKAYSTEVGKVIKFKVVNDTPFSLLKFLDNES